MSLYLGQRQHFSFVIGVLSMDQIAFDTLIWTIVGASAAIIAASLQLFSSDTLSCGISWNGEVNIRG